MFLVYYIFSGVFCATWAHCEYEDTESWYCVLIADFVGLLLGFLLLPMILATGYYERY
jgi:hypothetical protein